MIFVDYWLIRNSGLFDPAYYLLNYPDVRIADTDPLMHFVRRGWQEGRNPSKEFNVNYYLDTNADVRSSGVNPLVHYIRFGKAEGRSPYPRIAYRKKTAGIMNRNGLVLVKKRLTKNVFAMAVSYIRIYGLAVFLRKVKTYLFQDANAKGVSTKQPLRVYRNKHTSPPTYLENSIQQQDVKISVIIPTKNAGNEFGFLLKMLERQEGIREIELVIVDSGSVDDTVLIAKQYGAKIVQIKPEEFSHSFARNLGAENALGDYLLFMVQDALPPSRNWLFELFSLLKDKKVSAVSCAESPREDADLFYRYLCWNHYNFLEVNDGDRIFQLPDTRDQISLRKNAQLSDLACLIQREVFLEYKYRHDYGEDLDLGLRLIKDGKKLAFSGEIRVIHSHNRPAYYFLKRGYVDNLFLTAMFTDFVIPRINQEDLFADIAFTYQFLDNLTSRDLAALRFPVKFSVLEDTIVEAFNNCEKLTFPSTLQAQYANFKDEQYIVFIQKLIEPLGFKKQGQKYNGILISALTNHVNLMLDYLETVYDNIDEDLANEIKICMYKQLGIIIGSFLAFCYLNKNGKEPVNIDEIHHILKTGV